jgi:hypothetical protein
MGVLSGPVAAAWSSIIGLTSQHGPVQLGGSARHVEGCSGEERGGTAAPAAAAALQLQRQLLTSACTADGVEERLELLHAWNAEADHTAGLDLVSGGSSAASPRAWQEPAAAAAGGCAGCGAAGGGSAGAVPPSSGGWPPQRQRP